MSEVFLKIVNMSISASWAVLTILLLRILLKKSPKWITVLLWSIVAIRLIFPFSIESVFSLIPSTGTLNHAIMADKTLATTTDIPLQNTPQALIISAEPLQIWISILSMIWIAGMISLLAYSIISYWRIHRKVSTAILLQDNIFQSEAVISPFVLGIIKPNIYLPFYMSKETQKLVIAHEQAHIKRKDHLWKPLGFLFLALHWFNPLIWISYMSFCQDIELACDEKVIKDLNHHQRADYSQTLLNCSVNHHTITACPLAFGEVKVKERIKNVLNYKKSPLWIIIISLITVGITAACLLTNPPSNLLQNIESLDLTSYQENTVSLIKGNGETYEAISVFNNHLLGNLLKVRISKNPISQNRTADRDVTHTLILQNAHDIQSVTSSYFKGIYLYFNKDFTEVWVGTDVKPTLSYKVLNPEETEKIYDDLCNYVGANTDKTIVEYLDTP